MKKISKKRVFVTGGAGFIGSNLIEKLLKIGCDVTAYDNLSLGKKEFIKKYFTNPNFNFIKNDLANLPILKKKIAHHDVVFHLAANSDISRDKQITDIDLKQGTLATYNVLEAMKSKRIKEIIFASTSTVYGEPKKKPTPEDYGPLFPISLYGASKLACEGLISAFCHNLGFKAWIFRFANIVGPNATHGVMYDFIRKLKRNNRKLIVLGDGKQAKPYLHISECLDGVLYGYTHSSDEINVFNLACEGSTNVTSIAKRVVSEMGLKNAKIEFSGGKRGWPGDVTQVRLNASKLRKLGWKAQLSSNEAAKRSIKELVKQLT